MVSIYGRDGKQRNPTLRVLRHALAGLEQLLTESKANIKRYVRQKQAAKARILCLLSFLMRNKTKVVEMHSLWAAHIFLLGVTVLFSVLLCIPYTRVCFVRTANCSRTSYSNIEMQSCCSNIWTSSCETRFPRGWELCTRISFIVFHIIRMVKMQPLKCYCIRSSITVHYSNNWKPPSCNLE